jgi:HAD superfamily phosphoserine phosphatase-like hydrolase
MQTTRSTYSENFFNELDELIKNQTQPLFAAFDADGTLWSNDMGEEFFKWEIQTGVLQSVFSKLPKDPWRFYRDEKEQGDPRKAYLWLAQIHQGLPLATVQKWAQDFLKTFTPVPLFNEQRKLISFLNQRNVKVFVVTASIKWSVEPGAALYGIPAEQVLGVRTQVKNGLITDIQEGEITWKKGKAIELLNFTMGVKPILCSGNSMGDLDLMETASHYSIAINSANDKHENYATEMELKALGSKRGWMLVSF